ncbi:TPA: phage tail protein, partial [Escherichia coli]|nr:phage tail protein [Escherichia coli]
MLKKARTTANRKSAELKASRVREAQARAEADALKKALQTQAN